MGPSTTHYQGFQAIGAAVGGALGATAEGWQPRHEGDGCALTIATKTIETTT